MVEFKKFPPVSKELVEALEDIYRDQLPDHPVSGPDQMNMLIGQVSVVRFLRREFEHQNKNTLLEGT